MLDLLLVPHHPRQQKMQKPLASACPDACAEMPPFPKFWYVIAVDAIENNGGPSLIDRVAPAGWLIERAMKARWPRCIAAAGPISTRLGIIAAQKADIEIGPGSAV